MKILGIDPGLSGALALLEVANSDTTLVDVILDGTGRGKHE